MADLVVILSPNAGVGYLPVRPQPLQRSFAYPQESADLSAIDPVLVLILRRRFECVYIIGQRVQFFDKLLKSPRFDCYNLHSKILYAVDRNKNRVEVKIKLAKTRLYEEIYFDNSTLSTASNPVFFLNFIA